MCAVSIIHRDDVGQPIQRSDKPIVIGDRVEATWRLEQEHGVIHVRNPDSELVREGHLPACLMNEFKRGVGVRDCDAVADAAILR